MPNTNWFKATLKNPYARGAMLLAFVWTNYQPKSKSIAAIAWHVATQAQGAVANSIPDTTKPDVPAKKNRR